MLWGIAAPVAEQAHTAAPDAGLARSYRGSVYMMFDSTLSQDGL